MTILDKIIKTKKEEVTIQKKQVGVNQLLKDPLFSRKCNSLKCNLLFEKASGVIAEFKQKSPSKGVINNQADVTKVTKGYCKAGASGLSVLTDHEYFGGSLQNLLLAREANPEIPILMKDFMIDPYQVIEAKAHGADVILLIAASLEKSQMFELAQAAKEYGMEVLAEIHTSEEINKLNELIDIVGVNNRNLKTFEVSIELSKQLAPLIPDGYLKISESGLSAPANIMQLKEAGFKGFLIGETFMKTNNPVQACQDFISAIK